MIVVLFSAFQYTAIHQATNSDSGSSGKVLLVSNHDFTFNEVTLLRTLGEVSTVAGPVAVLQTTPKNLDEVQKLPFIWRTMHPHHLSVLLDRSVRDIGALRVEQEVKDSYGRNVTGKGVIVGFVDTGIDTTHPDFRFPNGTTKILYLWDQTVQGRPPSSFTYGFECSSIDIQNEGCPEVDTFGHGTHIAGIATSSGQATGNYTGVAPEARIVFVKSGNQTCNGSSWTFEDAHILDGINYIIKKSHQLGKRAVINLSLGGNIGGHDGTDPLEQALDAFVRDGTPIVVAAGNEARGGTHIHGQLKGNNVVTINMKIGSNASDLQIDSWYGIQDHINATLISPEGQTHAILVHAGTQSYMTRNITGRTASTGLGKEIYFEVSSPLSLPESGWKIKLTPDHIENNGTWDSWIDANSCTSPPAFFTPGEGYEIDPNDTISIPGTAHNVVTVGAYVTKVAWRESNGDTYNSTDLHVGEIARFSSLGPTRDGRTKPDIVAPGVFIASARSHLIPLTSRDPDAFHRILAGTSMAAPHVTGIIALMLQYSPSLLAAQVAALLRETAREDTFTGLLPVGGLENWGYGKADARTATGFYRLSLTNSGTSSAVFRVSIDNNDTRLQEGLWFDEYFLKGSVHQVSISRVVLEPNARYSVIGGNFSVSNNSLKVLTFKEQYFVNVISNFGPAKGSGWYDANTTTLVEGPVHLNANGYITSFGARLTLLGWLTRERTIVPNGEKMVKCPMTLTALYLLAYPWGLIGITLPLGLSILLTLRMNQHATHEEHQKVERKDEKIQYGKTA